VQQQRVEFWQLVRGILAKDLIFIDESGVNLAMVRLLARSPKGQRAHGKRPRKRDNNVSMLGAIRLEGVITQVAMLVQSMGCYLRHSSLKSLYQSYGRGLV
jgi:hypothetical protein